MEKYLKFPLKNELITIIRPRIVIVSQNIKHFSPNILYNELSSLIKLYFMGFFKVFKLPEPSGDKLKFVLNATKFFFNIKKNA